MAFDLVTFRESGYLHHPEDASAGAFAAWTEQPELTSLRGTKYRAAVAVLAPEGWMQNGSVPFVGWDAPEWHPGVTRVDSVCVCIPAAVLRQRLPEAIETAASIESSDERAEVIEALRALVDLVEAVEGDGDRVAIGISA